MRTRSSYGHSSGYRVIPTQHPDRWAWMAYGPRGNQNGEAGSHEDAERQAQEAERRLCQGLFLRGGAA